MGHTVQIYLVTPERLDADFADNFGMAMESGMVSAVLIARHGLSEEDYLARVGQLRPVAQANDVAVLLEDLPGAVRSSETDGAHITGGIGDFGTAAKVLKPEFITGAGDLRSRHEAMLRGEEGADYLMFGPLDALATDEDRELAAWWSETFEIPAALADPLTPVDQLKPVACEFIVLGRNVWSHPDGPIAALTLADRRLGTEAS